ncbi:DMT family transporter [Deinococcus aerius]|uniref:DMT family transporter n=1 Tax=Deinococcus aerius TaxID=200253 RepID=UPI000CCC99A1|nr:DMT family transporter [Deinococcus aerius]
MPTVPPGRTPPQPDPTPGPEGRTATPSPRGTERSFLLLVAVLAGSLLPTQFATNGALAAALGSVTLTGATSYLVGSVLLLGLLAVWRWRPTWEAARRAPAWSWLGGVVGSAYVVGSVILTRELGAALATTLVIASQIITAILLDHFGVLGLPRRRLNRARLLATALALAALALRLWGLR